MSNFVPDGSGISCDIPQVSRLEALTWIKFLAARLDLEQLQQSQTIDSSSVDRGETSRRSLVCPQDKPEFQVCLVCPQDKPEFQVYLDNKMPFGTCRDCYCSYAGLCNV